MSKLSFIKKLYNGKNCYSDHMTEDELKLLHISSNVEGIIKEMLKKNILPRLQYKKLDGTEVSISIYPVDNGKPDETIWVFEKRQ